MLCSTYEILSSPAICECWLYNLNLSCFLQVDDNDFVTSNPLGHLYLPIQIFVNDFSNLATLDNFHPFNLHSLNHYMSVTLTLKAHSFSILVKLVIPSFTKYTSGILLRQSRAVYKMQASASTPQRNTLHGVLGSAESKVSS